MNDEICLELVRTVQEVLATYKPSVNYAEELSPLLKQFAASLKLIDSKTINDSLLESVSRLAKTTKELSDVQIAALSKNVSPRYLNLTKNQVKIRNLITKDEAYSLVTSDEIEYTNGKFEYKNESVTYENIKNAAILSNAFDDITVQDILNFSRDLYYYPNFASQNPIGNKIFNECKNLSTTSITKIDNHSNFYRARIMNDESTLYSDEEMDKAPFSTPGQGRFNSNGISEFYVASQCDSSCQEVIKHSNKKDNLHIQIAEYENIKEMSVLDFTKIDNAFSKKCLKDVPNPKNLNVDYLLGGYIAQCLKRIGKLDGILYGKKEEPLFVFFSSKDFRIKNMLFRS